MKINENWWEARPDDSQEDAQRVEETSKFFRYQLAFSHLVFVTVQPVQPVRPVLNGKQMIRMSFTPPPIDSEEEMEDEEEDEMLSDEEEEISDKEEEEEG